MNGMADCLPAAASIRAMRQPLEACPPCKRERCGRGDFFIVRAKLNDSHATAGGFGNY